MSIYTSQLKHTFTICSRFAAAMGQAGKQVSLLLFQEWTLWWPLMLAKPRICFCEGTVYSAAPGTAAFAWASVNVFVDGFWDSQTDVCVLDFGICLADFFGGRFSLFCCWSCHLPGCPFLHCPWAFCHGFRLPLCQLCSAFLAFLAFLVICLRFHYVTLMFRAQSGFFEVFVLLNSDLLEFILRPPTTEVHQEQPLGLVLLWSPSLCQEVALVHLALSMVHLQPPMVPQAPPMPPLLRHMARLPHMLRQPQHMLPQKPLCRSSYRNVCCSNLCCTSCDWGCSHLCCTWGYVCCSHVCRTSWDWGHLCCSHVCCTSCDWGHLCCSHLCCTCWNWRHLRCPNLCCASRHLCSTNVCRSCWHSTGRDANHHRCCRACFGTRSSDDLHHWPTARNGHYSAKGAPHWDCHGTCHTGREDVDNHEDRKMEFCRSPFARWKCPLTPLQIMQKQPWRALDA